MQIFPDITSSRQSDTHAARASASHNEDSSSGRDSFSFAQLLATSSAALPAEITPELDGVQGASPSAALDQTSVTDAPYSETASTPASTLETPENIPTSEIRLTDSELRDLTESMRKEGVDEDTIKRVEDLAGHPNGVSVADVVQAVMQQSPAKLTEGDLQRIKFLADKIDVSGKLGESMLANIREGKTMQAWTSLTQALNALDPKTSLTIRRDEILSLGKALRLNDNTMNALSKAFGGREEALLSPSGFNRLMSPAQQALMNDAASRQKLLTALDKAFTPVIQDARERMKQEALAAGRASRRSLQSETLIQDTVTRNGFMRQGDPATRTDTMAAEKSTGQTVRPDEAKGKEKGQEKGIALDKAVQQAEKGAERSLKHGEEKPANPWEVLLERTDVTHLAGGINPQAGRTPLNIANLHRTELNARVLNQVEQAMLSAMRDGTKRLELQLKPIDLGVVNVLLSSKNGEVSAVMRPERPETATMLAQQVEHLRISLQEQGIKVDKVEVQTQLSDERGTSWQGMNEHNSAQEQQSRTLEMERMRRMARTRRDASGDGDGITAAVSGALIQKSLRMGSSLNVVA